MSCTEFIQVKFGFSLMDSRGSRSMTRPWYVHWRSDTVCHKYTSSTDWRQMVRSEVKPLISADSLWQGQTHICLPSLESKGEKETKKKKKARGHWQQRSIAVGSVFKAMSLHLAKSSEQCYHCCQKGLFTILPPWMAHFVRVKFHWQVSN